MLMEARPVVESVLEVEPEPVPRSVPLDRESEGSPPAPVLVQLLLQPGEQRK